MRLVVAIIALARVQALCLFLAAASIWCAIPPAQAQVAFKFENWRGYYTVSASGDFQACFTEAFFTSGDRLQFWLTPQQYFAFGLQQRGQVDKNQRTARIWVDDNPALSAQVAYYPPISIFQIGPLKKNVVELFESLRMGRVLSIQLADKIHTFSLSGTYGALSELFGCARQAQAGHPPAALHPQTAAAAKPPATPPAAHLSPASSLISTASGFVVSKGGFIVTNAHAVEGCGKFRVASDGGKEEAARLVAKDTQNDLALLQSPELQIAPIPFRVTLPRLGETVYAYGFPLNSLLASSGNFGSGMISALVGVKDDSSRLQVSVPVQPGNSGGPLLDKSGAVIGVIVAKLNAVSVAEKTGDIPQNVNFAIKGTVVRTFLESYGVPITTGTSGQPDAADIAEIAKKASVRVDCLR